MTESDARVPAAFGHQGLPKPLLRYFELFGAGRYWDSHEALEDLWRETGSDFYQALILYASAWVHWERGNAHGVVAQLGKTLERLSDYPSSYLAVDVGALRAHCSSVRAIVRNDAERWRDVVEPMSLAPSPSRVRGDEDELKT